MTQRPLPTADTSHGAVMVGKGALFRRFGGDRASLALALFEDADACSGERRQLTTHDRPRHPKSPVTPENRAC